jgi:neutral ceramidase
VSALRAGAARMVMTPPLGCHISGYYHDRIAGGIRDDLYAKSIVLESSDTSLAIVVCDVIGLPKEDVDRAKARAQELTGIPSSHILVAATHTHFGPATEGGYEVPREEEFMAQLPDRVASSVKLAQNRLRPALVGHASGSCPGEVFNRRYFMQDGTVITNPGRRPEVVRPAGPTDPEVGVLVFLDEQRHPIALLANYALHYVGPGPSGHETISADYFGAFDRTIQRLAGRELVGIMLNGCCGDVNNIDVFGPEREYPYSHYQVDRVANVVAGVAFQAWNNIHRYEPSAVLAAANALLSIRREEVSEAQIAAAKERLAQPDSQHQARQATSADPAWLKATRVLDLVNAPRERPAPIQAMRIGEVGLASLPGEIFVEIGLGIKKESPFSRTLVGELSNGTVGYVPSDTAFEQGSYEVYTSVIPRGTGTKMLEAAVGLLKELAG